MYLDPYAAHVRVDNMRAPDTLVFQAMLEQEFAHRQEAKSRRRERRREAVERMRSVRSAIVGRAGRRGGAAMPVHPAWRT